MKKTRLVRTLAPVCLVAVVLGCGGGAYEGGDGSGGAGGGGETESGSTWDTYTSDDFGFSIDMPGDPKVADGSFSFNTDLSEGLDAGVYSVWFHEHGDIEEANLDLHLKLAGSKYPGDYVEQGEEFVEWNGHRAFTAKAQGPGDQSGICTRNLAVHIDGITYSLAVMSNCETIDADAEKFFGSFKLLDGENGNGGSEEADADGES